MNMTKKTVGVGVIGAGMIGSVHAQNLATRVIGAQVVAVMDIDLKRAEAVAAACGAPQAYSEAAALIADPAVDAVLIATPDVTHADLTLACIEAGKPVLCEKPLATTVADAERVVRAELAAGRRLVQVGFMRVYDPAHTDLYSLLRRGDIGGALRFRGIHINPNQGYTNTVESAIVNSLIHDIHSARWLMGAELRSVYVQWLPAHSNQARSSRLIVIQATFDNQALGTLEWSGDSGYGYEVMVEITGETGTAQTFSHSSPILRQGDTLSQMITPNWPERFETAYIIEAQTWINSILKDTPTGPSAWDGYMSLVVAEACIRSSQSAQPETVPAIEVPALYR